ncbi:MAG TPA: 8-amino-7-oxononanoate synthase [Candidatus Paceibacterota bacterium]|nr:8-amino-7-oxononanoate synthase [Candidatus Paceibacterota bacterium]
MGDSVAIMKLEEELTRRLAKLREQGLYRTLREIGSAQGPRLTLGNRTVLNFGSNDYLGLAGDPRVKEAAAEAARHWGAGSGASRLVCGNLEPHVRLERALAEFKQTEAALTFSSGYTTAVGTLCALAGKDDIVILDKRAHACLVDGARLSGARLRVFAHNDLEDLEHILKWAADVRARRVQAGTAPPVILIVTESVFSMDGDTAPLRKIAGLKDAYDAWLLVDEAHATGLLGPAGAGLAAELDAHARIEVLMGTLGKALGSAGGFICGSRTLIDYLVNRARSFIFSTAPVPAAAAAAAAALELVRGPEGEELRLRLKQRVSQFQAALGRPNLEIPTAIVPLVLGPAEEAMRAAAELLEAGIYVPAIRYPAVARGAARLRITLSAAHSAEDVGQLAAAIRGLQLQPAGDGS